uniref:Uncharacterized protein n=1 Tax=Oryza meridionalis TaxID=40149 RepID=A0A0E0D4H6_9ORYZ
MVDWPLIDDQKPVLEHSKFALRFFQPQVTRSMLHTLYFQEWKAKSLLLFVKIGIPLFGPIELAHAS